MGQKVSSFSEALPWKNSDSSRTTSNNSFRNSSRRESMSLAADTVSSAIDNALSRTDPQHFVNIKILNADTEADVISVDNDHAKCCDMSTMVDVEAATKTGQLSKNTNSSKKHNHWVLRFNCSRLKSKNSKCDPPESVPEPSVEPDSCVCTRYRRTEDHHLGAGVVFDATSIDQPEENLEEPIQAEVVDNEFDGAFNTSYNAFSSFHTFDNDENGLILPSFDDDGLLDMHSTISGEEYMTEDFEDRAYKERAKEIQEGIEPPPGFRPGLHIQLLQFSLPKMTIDNLTSLFQRAAISALTAPPDLTSSQRIHTSIDYIHYLVPDLLQITTCSFYWGKMDRYEAEKLLENRPEGTFLLRDSAQEEYLFSVSFRKYGRSLHARIEQWNHLFSFDSRDPGVFASSTVCGLIEHYKDPSCCMFFEPMLTIPLNRNFVFSLQHTCRATICNKITYDDVNMLKLPKILKSYLKEYHYKQRVRVRIFDTEN